MFQHFKNLSKNLKTELKIYQLMLNNPRTPKTAKILLGFALAYMVSPIDFIPDFVPILGQLDDFIMVPFLVYIALKMIPGEIIRDCRMQAGAKVPSSPA